MLKEAEITLTMPQGQYNAIIIDACSILNKMFALEEDAKKSGNKAIYNETVEIRERYHNLVSRMRAE